MLKFFDKISGHLQTKVCNLTTMSNFEEMKYWSQIVLAYSQLEGLYRGYTYAINQLGPQKAEEMKMSIADFLVIQADGEISDLMRSIHAQESDSKLGDKDYFWKAFGYKVDSPIDFWKQVLWTSKCSAFIKIVQEDGNWKDLYSGHTTWTEYYEMLRQYKQ
jgi:hypothetical protein